MAYKPKAKKLPQMVAALTGCIGGFCLGTVIGWSSPAGKPLKKLDLNGKQVSWIGCINCLGSAFSVLPLPFIMDRIGRRLSMMIIAVFLCLSWIMLAFVETFWLLIIARFLCGFFSGSFCVVSPVYTGEVVEPRIRGALGSCFQLFIVFGIFVLFAIGLTENLLVLSLFSAVCPVVMIVILIFLPDSPLFLIDSGKDEERIDKAFIFLRGKDYDFTEEKVELAKELIEADERKAGNLMDKFKTKATKKGFIIGLGLNIAQQLSGINVLMYYATKIFADSGTAITPEVCSVILGVGQIVGTLLAVAISDRAGRKILLIISFAVMAVCLLIMGCYSFFTRNEDLDDISSGIRLIPVFVTTIYVIAFSIGAGPLVWALIGEMFAPEVKGVVSSICAFSNWMFAFIITSTYTYMEDVFKPYGAYWFYSAAGFLCVVFIIFMVIETKNKTLREIQIALGGDDTTKESIQYN
ncbi:facilitated trehalose transporter Tret1-like [Chrysoperla carnea]|uniref:facilitated trehalose transporter Tret1-like n=1 Tax=Chrysoperla carnea TaxID=189513 RepID=UPI001D0655C0|nr:facilitated trehalose transporter Tret1-like [Chrysoperla carnea]